jgi:hypothetical protein
MLNRVNRKQELDRVNMLIRALSDEMTRQQALDASMGSASAEMQEALYELRLRKLMISAFVGSSRIARRTSRH